MIDEKSAEEQTLQSNKPESSKKEKPASRVKFTIYLSEEAENAFTELYIHRLRKDRKAERSKIACDALLALYEKECCVSE